MRIQCECLLGIYGDTHCDCEQQKNEALFDTNLSFADKNTAIEEELAIYELLNNE